MIYDLMLHDTHIAEIMKRHKLIPPDAPPQPKSFIDLMLRDS